MEPGNLIKILCSHYISPLSADLDALCVELRLFALPGYQSMEVKILNILFKSSPQHATTIPKVKIQNIKKT